MAEVPGSAPLPAGTEPEPRKVTIVREPRGEFSAWFEGRRIPVSNVEFDTSQPSYPEVKLVLSAVVVDSATCEEQRLSGEQ